MKVNINRIKKGDKIKFNGALGVKEVHISNFRSDLQAYSLWLKEVEKNILIPINEFVETV